MRRPQLVGAAVTVLVAVTAVGVAVNLSSVPAQRPEGSGWRFLGQSVEPLEVTSSPFIYEVAILTKSPPATDNGEVLADTETALVVPVFFNPCERVRVADLTFEDSHVTVDVRTYRGFSERLNGSCGDDMLRRVAVVLAISDLDAEPLRTIDAGTDTQADIERHD